VFGYFRSRFLSMPLVGLVAYATVFVVSLLWPNGKALQMLAFAGGAMGLGLLYTQAFVLHAFCWLCSVVDVAALAAAAAAFAHQTATTEPEHFIDPLQRRAWGALLVLAIGAPLLWPVVKPAPPVPLVIVAGYVPEKINVIEFADFECPFCRKLHPLLKGVIESYPPGSVHFVRKQVPLEMHPDAKPAARAAICAEAQGKGEKLADRLVEIELSASAVRRAAVEVGVDAGAFDRCLASPDPDKRIAADTKLLEDAGMEGLPTTYVGGKRLLGVVSEAALRDAFDRAARNEKSGGVPGWLYIAMVIALAAAATWSGRSPRGSLNDGSGTRSVV
jgi:protein-disulfide isomerase